MTTPLFYLVAVLLSGAAICVLAFTATRIAPRLRNWPTFWSTALCSIAAIPVLGWVLNVFAPVGMLPDSSTMTLIGAVSLFDPSVFGGPGQEAVGAAAPFGVGEIAVAIYLSGLVFFGIRLFGGRVRALSIAAAADGPLENSGIRYWLSDEARAPFAITGFLPPRPPRIVVPRSFAQQLCEEQLACILRHEQAHVDRGDDFTGLALRTVVAIFWFNPFAHMLFARWSDAVEMLCDNAAILSGTPEMRSTYANTLLNALHIMAGRVRQYPAASFSTHRIRSEKMRIRQIMKGAPQSFKSTRANIVLALAAIGCSAIGAVSVAANEASSPVTIASPQTAATTANVVIVKGRVTSKFGKRVHPDGNGKTQTHWGVDIAAPTGTAIYAPSDGSIVEATNLFDGKPAYGIVVVHQAPDGLLTLFAHLDGFVVQPGQTVKSGQKIAMVGNTGKSTGPHVHIETSRNGQRIDPFLAWPQLQ